MSKKLLIVDDEAAVRRLLRRCFETEGYEVVEAESGPSMFTEISAGDIDLITLDIGLGEQDGLELARAVRKEHHIPIVMITGKGELIDTVLGLEMGADDYISKPFELREVLARVRAVLRRYELQTDRSTSVPAPPGEINSRQIEGGVDKCYKFDSWLLDTASRELHDDNQGLCELTTAEYELLKLMVTHSRQVLSRDQIMDQLKGNDWVPTDRTIDNQISRLRRKLQSAGDDTQYIKTVRGAGYMFNAIVTSITD